MKAGLSIFKRFYSPHFYWKKCIICKNCEPSGPIVLWFIIGFVGRKNTKCRSVCATLPEALRADCAFRYATSVICSKWNVYNLVNQPV